MKVSSQRDTTTNVETFDNLDVCSYVDPIFSTFCGDLQIYNFDPSTFVIFYAEDTNEGLVACRHHHKAIINFA